MCILTWRREHRIWIIGGTDKMYSLLYSENICLALSSCFLTGKCRAALQAEFWLSKRTMVCLLYKASTKGVHALLCYSKVLRGLYKCRPWLPPKPVSSPLLYPQFIITSGPSVPKTDTVCVKLAQCAKMWHRSDLPIPSTCKHLSHAAHATYRQLSALRGNAADKSPHRPFSRLYQLTSVLCATKSSTNPTTAVIPPEASLLLPDVALFPQQLGLQWERPMARHQDSPG